MDLFHTLRTAAAREMATADGWAPRVFDRSREPDRAAVGQLLDAGDVVSVRDTIRDQLAELCTAREPALAADRAGQDARVDRALGDRPAEEYGRWVHYPWSRRLVHVLPPATLLVEECDDLYMKVRLREEAGRLGIPVVMETSDRGLLDVERFDREPGRPPLHGLAGGVRAADLKGLTTREKIPSLLKILDADRLSPAAAACLVEIQETLATWPQLASAVALGGAVVADAARRLLLGRFTESGRYYVDVERIVRDGAAVPPAPVPPADEPSAGAGRRFGSPPGMRGPWSVRSATRRRGYNCSTPTPTSR